MSDDSDLTRQKLLIKVIKQQATFIFHNSKTIHLPYSREAARVALQGRRVVKHPALGRLTLLGAHILTNYNYWI